MENMYALFEYTDCNIHMHINQNSHTLKKEETKGEKAHKKIECHTKRMNQIVKSMLYIVWNIETRTKIKCAI